MNASRQQEAPPSPPLSATPHHEQSNHESRGMIDLRWRRPLIIISENASSGNTSLSGVSADSFITEVRAALVKLDDSMQMLDSRLQALEEGTRVRDYCLSLF